LRLLLWPLRVALWSVLTVATALWPLTALEPLPQFPDWLPVARETVRPGDTFDSLTRRFGLPPELVPRMVAACEGVVDLRRIRPGDPLLLVRRSVGDTLRLVHYSDPEQCLVLTLPLAQKGDSLHVLEGECVARVERLEAQTRQVEHRGQVDATLYDAMVGSGGSPQLALAFTDIFQWDVDFLTDIQGGERFWLVVEEKRLARPYLGDSVTVEGRILAASFQAAGTAGKLIQACWHEGCGQPGYFDSQGRSFQKQFLKSPLNYRRISSQFGMRSHPVLRRVRMHEGIDYSAPHGTPVVAAAAGTVTTAGWERGYGKVVRIRHDRKRTTVYGHLSSLAEGVRKGARVDQNQLVGRVGATGLATGPHLHYEYIENGRSVDPGRAISEPGKPVASACMGDYLTRFQKWFAEPKTP
jgi:murein DD-endopeptidase MepM/ murein hydrolase activator NlpD